MDNTLFQVSVYLFTLPQSLGDPRRLFGPGMKVFIVFPSSSRNSFFFCTMRLVFFFLQ